MTLTNQQAFNTVAEHLIRQNKRSAVERDGEFCRYRHGDMRCAIGCLIPDDEYREEYEGNNVDRLSAAGCRAIEGLDLRLLRLLQTVHDGYPVWNWPEALRAIGVSFSLTCPSCLTTEAK